MKDEQAAAHYRRWPYNNPSIRSLYIPGTFQRYVNKRSRQMCNITLRSPGAAVILPVCPCPIFLAMNLQKSLTLRRCLVFIAHRSAHRYSLHQRRPSVWRGFKAGVNTPTRLAIREMSHSVKQRGLVPLPCDASF